jgi:hypothetical protein
LNLRIKEIFEEYAKHAVLNFGQALQGIRYLFSHPDSDEVAVRGSLRHLILSLRLRTKLVANDLVFAAMPPHWHHSRQELAGMRPVPARMWFQYGYCAWKFDEAGAARTTLPANIDRRWDPRCKKEAPLLESSPAAWYSEQYGIHPDRFRKREVRRHLWLECGP